MSDESDLPSVNRYGSRRNDYSYLDDSHTVRDYPNSELMVGKCPSCGESWHLMKYYGDNADYECTCGQIIRVVG